MNGVPLTRARLADTHRLIPSRYPPVGILDTIAEPDDLELMMELEGWTNDRLSAQLGFIRAIPKAEWVLGRPMATVIMAAFCHPHVEGSRFNSSDLGAWYAAMDLDTAHTEAIHWRTIELEETGVLDARVQMREYLADMDETFHDIRGDDPAFAPLYDPNSYVASQAFAVRLRTEESNGVLYRSVRRPGGECIACFRPRLVNNVRQARHFEYRWSGSHTPTITTLPMSSAASLQ